MLTPSQPPPTRWAAAGPDVAVRHSATHSFFSSVARLAAATVVVLSPGSIDTCLPAYAGGSVGQPFGGSSLGGPPIAAVSAAPAPYDTAVVATPDVALSAAPSAGGGKIGESERELLKSAFTALDDGDLKEGTATVMRPSHPTLHPT